MKNLYELAFIIKSALDLDKARGGLDEMLGYLTKQGAEIVFEGMSEKREMAYEIQKDKFGIYAVVIFKAEPKAIKALEDKIRLDLNIVRHLVVSMEAVKADIDVSIANARTLLSGIVPKRAHPMKAKPARDASRIADAGGPKTERVAKREPVAAKLRVAKTAAEKKEDRAKVEAKIDKLLKDEDIQ